LVKVEKIIFFEKVRKICPGKSKKIYSAWFF